MHSYEIMLTNLYSLITTLGSLSSIYRQKMNGIINNIEYGDLKNFVCSIFTLQNICHHPVIHSYVEATVLL